MNPFDRENLSWYMTASHSEIQEWLDQATETDLNYMLRLIKVSKTENIIQMLEVLDDQSVILPQTKNLLKQFTI